MKKEPTAKEKANTKDKLCPQCEVSYIMRRSKVCLSCHRKNLAKKGFNMKSWYA